MRVLVSSLSWSSCCGHEVEVGYANLFHPSVLRSSIPTRLRPSRRVWMRRDSNHVQSCPCHCPPSTMSSLTHHLTQSLLSQRKFQAASLEDEPPDSSSGQCSSFCRGQLFSIRCNVAMSDFSPLASSVSHAPSLTMEMATSSFLRSAAVKVHVDSQWQALQPHQQSSIPSVYHLVTVSSNCDHIHPDVSFLHHCVFRDFPIHLTDPTPP